MKKAFTLLELVFVIVVIGIISATMIPRLNSTGLQEAAIQLVSHIRYTQHLAMIDDKYDGTDANTTNPQWYRQRWQLMFTKDDPNTEDKYSYSIYSDSGDFEATASDVKPNNNEFALDPLNNGKYLSGGTQSLKTSNEEANKKMNLGLSYGIEDYSLTGGCRSSRITFDHLGRPISGALGDYITSYKISTTTASPKLMNETCVITLCSISDCSIASNEEKIEILIESETGYSHIL